MNFKRTFLRNRNNKIYYYIKAILREIVPDTFARLRLRRLLSNSSNLSYIADRVNYYNKLEGIKKEKIVESSDGLKLEQIKPTGLTGYP